MRRGFLAAIVLLGVQAAPLTVVAGSVIMESQPLGRTLELDGSPVDWEGVATRYLQESVRVLGVTHDADTMYVMFRFSDQRLARMILNSGVILWLNGDGKKKTKYGVRYSGSEQVAEAVEELAPQRDPGSVRSSPEGRRRPPNRGPRQAPGTLTVIVDGLKDDVPETNPGGPTAASAVADDVYAFELAIPLQDVGGKVAGRVPDKKREIALGIEIGGLTEGEKEMMREAMGDRGGMGGGGTGGMRPGGGGGGRGGGGMGRGGMGGGGRGGPGGDRVERLLGGEIVWVKVTLLPIAG